MKTLRDRAKVIIDWNTLTHVELQALVEQMDALLEECYQALQCPIKSQVMVELLKNNGYGATLGITVEGE